MGKTRTNLEGLLRKYNITDGGVWAEAERLLANDIDELRDRLDALPVEKDDWEFEQEAAEPLRDVGEEPVPPPGVFDGNWQGRAEGLEFWGAAWRSRCRNMEHARDEARVRIATLELDAQNNLTAAVVYAAELALKNIITNRDAMIELRDKTEQERDEARREAAKLRGKLERVRKACLTTPGVPHEVWAKQWAEEMNNPAYTLVLEHRRRILDILKAPDAD